MHWLTSLAMRGVMAMLRLGARHFGVPPKFFELMKVRTGLGRTSTLTIPIGAVHTGSLLLARGFVNNELFQIIGDWILPFWVYEGLDPTSRGYLPRSLTMLFLNLAHRNWTTIGLPGGEQRAVVDPRGLVTPTGERGWSLDTWLCVEGTVYSPSLEHAAVVQTVDESLPLVRTEVQFAGLSLKLTLETSIARGEEGRPMIVHRARVSNDGERAVNGALLFSLRPFGPEGATIAHRIELEGGRCWSVNGNEAIRTERPADRYHVSSFEGGDVSHQILTGAEGDHITCRHGLAQAASSFDFTVGPDQSFSEAVTGRLTSGSRRSRNRNRSLQRDPPAAGLSAEEEWTEALRGTMRVALPDPRLQAAYRANVRYMLLFCQGRDGITPGPGIYDQFWFRDATYMLSALSRVGLTGRAKPILESYPRRQRRNGQFFSQTGEWDSTGQAIWAITDCARVSNDRDLLVRCYSAIARGAGWIERTRCHAPGAAHDGLFPPGLSAEHLGPDDYFYWDDFWGAAGLREAAWAADELGRPADSRRYRAAFEAFWDDIERSLATNVSRLGSRAIPASPYRHYDSALIAAIAAYYPLRLMEIDDPRLAETLERLEDHLIDGIFYHVIAHSGYNSYLNLQLAQCYLAQGARERAWKILDWLLDCAASTWTWPEAIHPKTLGGVMGDGHHGWAAAELLLLTQSLLIREEHDSLVIGAGIPARWIPEPGGLPAEVTVTGAATRFGVVDLTILLRPDEARLEIKPNYREPPSRIRIDWPLPLGKVTSDGRSVEHSEGGGCEVSATAGLIELSYSRREQ